MLWATLISAFLAALARGDGYCQDISCSYKNCNKGTQAYLGNGSTLSCTVKKADGFIPTSTQAAEPAPPADNITVGCHEEYDDILAKDRAILDLSWMYREDTIRKGDVEGFLLTISVDSVTSYYDVSFKIKGGQNDKQRDIPPCIVFRHNCYGRTSSIRGYSYTCRVYALPHHQKGDETNSLRKPYKVPWKCGKEKRKLKTSSSNKEITIAIGIHDSSTKDDNSSPLLPLLCIPFIVLIVIVVSIIMWKVIRKRRKKARKSTNISVSSALITKNCFIVAKDEDHQRANRLGERLKRKRRLRVTTNWENRNKITNEGMPWYCQRFEQSEVVIFINATEEYKIIFSKNNNNKQRRQQNHHSNNKYSVVACAISDYFKNDQYLNRCTIFLEDDVQKFEKINECRRPSLKAFAFKTDYSEDDEFYQFLLETKEDEITKSKSKDWGRAA